MNLCDLARSKAQRDKRTDREGPKVNRFLFVAHMLDMMARGIGSIMYGFVSAYVAV